jgi:hypothetical protein
MKKNLNPLNLISNAFNAIGRGLHNLFFNDTREFEKLKHFLAA